MPAARVADRSPMALLPLRESARGGGQQQQAQKQQQPQQNKEGEGEAEQEQNQLQQRINTGNIGNNGKATAAKSEEQCQREREMCAKLMQRRDQLEEQLIARLDELKDICIAEGELVGQLPTEIYKCLLPGETEPAVKRRVGTAFKFPQEVLTIRRRNSKDNGDGGAEQNEGRQLSQLEAEIELNRRIVAAAERLAKDKSVNKSVRKKRRKDLQLAAQRLRGLEKGLHRLRLSNSKPDVSTMGDGCGGAVASASIGHQSGSGFSLNSLKAWPNFYNTFRMSSNTKSCPATPRGSVPDLTMSSTVGAAAASLADNANGADSGKKRRTTPNTAKKLHKMLSRDHPPLSSACANASPPVGPTTSPGGGGGHPSEVPLSSSSSSLSGLLPASSSSPSSSGISSATPSLSSSSNLLSLSSVAPPVPSRRCSSSGSSASAGGGVQQSNAAATADDGRTPSTSGTASDELPRQNSSSHLYANIGYQSSSPYKSAYRQCHFPTLLQQTSPPLCAYQQPMSFSTSFSVLKDLSLSSNDGSSCCAGRPSLCPSSPCGSSAASLAAVASSHMGQIVRRLDAARPLRPPLVVRRSGGGGATLSESVHGQAHSTGSLDRRLRRAEGTTPAKPLMKKMASATTGTIWRPAFVQLSPPPRLPRTNAVEQLAQPQLTTTFPTFPTRPAASVAATDRRDNGTQKRHLLDVSGRFRSVSAVSDKNGRGQSEEKPFPRPNDRLEALLASIHRQSQIGIPMGLTTAQNDGSPPVPAKSPATTTKTTTTTLV